MRDIVEEALRSGDGPPPDEVRSVRVAVVGVGAAGADRLAGVARRLRDEAFVGQIPTDIDAVAVDLPGAVPTVTGWMLAARHAVERFDRARGGRPALPLEATERLRRFGGDGLAGYDALVLALDGTDRAAVSAAGALAAAFRGGPNHPVIAVPTVPADAPPQRPLGAADGSRTGMRVPFGPDAVVPVEGGRASERRPSGSGDGPLDAARDPAETVATDVTAALAEALGTRTQFGSPADDLHHLRGRVTVHVGRRRGPLDAGELVADALSTPLSGRPLDRRDGGAWLGHLRTTTPEDADIDAVMNEVGTRLADLTGVGRAERPAGLASYRLAATEPHELFLFRAERPDAPDDRSAATGTDGVDADELGLGGELPRSALDLGNEPGEGGGDGFDVVR